ncbi:MAG TPA: M14 family zinc carboxypeptidase [Vicinamibacterales bacterium]|nr:M14 family zinc carboxypeptidase [Vicinamibacterales bacterium]
MPGRITRTLVTGCVLALTSILAAPPAAAQARKAPAQQIDAEYTAKIKEHTQDPRVITELVDHLPASDTVPTPLAFLGRIPGTPDELTYYKDILRYMEALAKASPRVKLLRIGKSDEGRDMIMVFVADEATIKNLDRFRKIANDLADPRALSEAQARQLIAAGKPIYWATGNLHSGETGSAEMMMELAYRLAVEESPFIRNIRSNIIVALTPVLEVDGREKVVDNLYFRKKTGQTLPLTWWGKYVAHDNNRDGIGVGLALTQHVLKAFIEWKPTVLHDLHESIPYLYASTGAGPYNTNLDPLVTDEWWMLAKHEVSEMTKRGVPGVWTGGFYDGWTPNYLFFIANLRNSIGRFYETQSYGPANQEITLGATQTSREWYRPNPPLPTIKWGPRNNVNMQQSALLFALQYTAKNRETMLENFYLKGRRAVERGRAEAPHAFVIPSGQYRRGEVVAVVNMLRLQGAEVHTADAAFKAGGVEVAAGDYLIRMDQPYSVLVKTLLGTQYFPPQNPSPYDDTGWSAPLMRNVVVHRVDDKAILEQPATLLAADLRPKGGISGSGNVLLIEHNVDNKLVTFRFALPDVKMLAAEAPFEAAGRKFEAGAFVIPGAEAARIAPVLEELGLTAYAVAAAPGVKTHELDVPRIGYVHSWQRTQDEGWVRLALDHFKVPYTYFGDTKLREGNLRAKFDVILFPHVGGTPQSQLNGLPMTGDPLPHKKTELTPNLGVLDSADDIRGGMGLEGLAHLVKFVEEGGLLITEGSTATIFPTYGITQGVTVEEAPGLFARGVLLKAVFGDRTSPIAYGYNSERLPVYFSQAPILAVGGAGGIGRGGPPIPGVGMNLTPNAVPERLASLDGSDRPMEERRDEGRGGAMQGGAGGRGGAAGPRPRVILRFPSDPDDMLLSGGLVGGQALANRVVVADAPVGKGHVVLFATRPYWRWQTHGTFFLGFNAILNWNDLDAGKAQGNVEGGR